MMLSEGRRFIETAWWLGVFPGLAISLVVLSFNMMGDTLRDVFDDLIKVCPNLAAAIITSDGLRTELAVALDGSILDSTGLLESVKEDAEIYLVPPIGGG